MKFSPSLTCMDALDIRNGILSIDEKADLYHVDIMDGHFVPNLAMCPSQVAAIHSISRVPIDCHLMVDRPQDYVDILIKAGATYICPHAETLGGQAFRLFSQIKEGGCKAGVVLNPETPLSAIQHYLSQIDMLTIMTVDPGFAAQPFIWEMIEKIREAKALREKYGLNFLIQSDGGCNEATYKALTEAGADAMVMGSTSLFGKSQDLSEAWDKMVQAYQKAIQ